ncbi:MAG: aminomethyltransferase family protein [Planctomycetota bacterium]|nr:aminomethyltransferase family protein [Planctomycetota bacterium]
MRSLPLGNVWEQRGARWTEEADWKVPADFGDPAAEHAAVRQSAGVIDLTPRGTLRFLGKDRVDFLQRLLSGKVRDVSPPGWEPSLLLTPKGKIIADMRVVILSDAVIMDVAPSNPGPLKARLEKYVLSSDVEIEDRTAQTVVLSVHGPHAPDALRRLFGAGGSLPGARDVVETDIEGVPCQVLRSSLTGEEGFDIFIPTKGSQTVWEAIDAGGGLTPVGRTTLEVCRVEAGIPFYGADFGEETIPLEARLEEWLCLEKGCFPGQEVVARATHRGGVRRRIQGLIIDAETPLPPRSPVFKEGLEVGWVSSAVRSLDLDRVVALAYIRNDQLDPPDRFEVRSKGRRYPAKLSELPFYRRTP